MLEKIQCLLNEVEGLTANSAEEIEQLRIKYLSKKGAITALMADFRNVPAEQKKEIAGGLVELGQEMGMNLSVEDVDTFRFQVRDKNGRLIDSATLGTTVDPTGWNTTVPVLGGSAMILLALGGFAVMLRRTGRQEDQSNG